MCKRAFKQCAYIRFVDGLTAKLGWLDRHHITLLDINGLSSRIDAELTDNALVFIGQSAKHFPDVFCFNLNKQKMINASGNHTQLTGLDFGLAKIQLVLWRRLIVARRTAFQQKPVKPVPSSCSSDHSWGPERLF